MLSTGGQLVLTDLDATAATVVVQSDVAGSYGKFSVDATGKWSYVTNDALNQLNAGQRVTGDLRRWRPAMAARPA